MSDQVEQPIALDVAPERLREFEQEWAKRRGFTLEQARQLVRSFDRALSATEE